MKYIKVKMLKEPGFYWWLPEDHIEKSDDSISWQVVSWHPDNPARVRSGVAYGPLVAPCFKKGDLQ
jgi:hypothetical protein